MMTEHVKKNDGRWHAVGAVQAIERFTRWTGHLPGRPNTVDYTRRGFRGRVARMNESRKWEFDVCPHCHTKRGAAAKCAEAAARRLNRAEEARNAAALAARDLR